MKTLRVTQYNQPRRILPWRFLLRLSHQFFVGVSLVPWSREPHSRAVTCVFGIITIESGEPAAARGPYDPLTPCQAHTLPVLTGYYRGEFTQRPGHSCSRPVSEQEKYGELLLPLATRQMPSCSLGKSGTTVL